MHSHPAPPLPGGQGCVSGFSCAKKIKTEKLEPHLVQAACFFTGGGWVCATGTGTLAAPLSSGKRQHRNFQEISRVAAVCGHGVSSVDVLCCIGCTPARCWHFESAGCSGQPVCRHRSIRYIDQNNLIQTNLLLKDTEPTTMKRT